MNRFTIFLACLAWLFLAAFFQWAGVLLLAAIITGGLGFQYAIDWLMPKGSEQPYDGDL